LKVPSPQTEQGVPYHIIFLFWWMEAKCKLEKMVLKALLRSVAPQHLSPKTTLEHCKQKLIQHC
jgi:hypothetical protein